MARRPPEEVVNILIDRKVHAKLRDLQILLRARTLSDAMEKALTLVDEVNYRTIATLIKE
jgi:hypothetical protein